MAVVTNDHESSNLKESLGFCFILVLSLTLEIRSQYILYGYLLSLLEAVRRTRGLAFSGFVLSDSDLPAYLLLRPW